jgi:hypothetical protein
MRSTPIVVATALLLPWSSTAQVPSVVESSALQADSRSWRQVLRNQSPSSPVAYSVGCIPKSGLTMISDALIDGGSFVDTGKSFESQVNEPSRCEAGVHAAVFSDGHAEGEPEFV